LKLLLDTNAVLWWMGREEAERGDVGRLLADPDNDVLLSVVCLCEMAIKKRAGKLDASIDAVIADAEMMRFTRISIEDAHLHALADLPRHHRDPFDHLLIAQAIAEKAAFVTRDRMAARYPVDVISLG
jgi:PIN domain nuclease of toxin-antitoxin system